MKKINRRIISIVIISAFIFAVGCAHIRKQSQASQNITVYDNDGYDKYGYDKDGYDRNGFNKKGYNIEGYKSRELDENGRPLLNKWGFEGVQTEGVSNDRDYDWYIDQDTTGEYADINCVPTGCVMALKWVNKDFNMTVEQARNEYLERYNQTIGWDWLQAIQYMKENGAKVREYRAEDYSLGQVIDELKNGSILLVDLNMGAISYAKNKEDRVGRYVEFTGDPKHQIIVKGYKVVNEKIYFEVYDPGSSGNKRDDGTSIGENIYYSAEEVMKSATTLTSGHFLVIDGSTYDFGEKDDKPVKLEKSLDDAVREQLGIKDRDITKEDLKRMFTLRVVDQPVSDFQSIKSMVNLDTIILSNCSIKDIRFVDQFRDLKRLTLGYNQISDISSIKQLGNLEYLHLNNNMIVDVSPIMNLKNLKELYISENPARDLSQIKKMNIKYNDYMY